MNQHCSRDYMSKCGGALIEVLWEHMCIDSRAALSACSTQMRRSVRQVAKSVTVDSKQDLVILGKGTWYNLTTITAHCHCDPWDEELTGFHKSLQLLTAIHWSESKKMLYTAFVVTARDKLSTPAAVEIAATCYKLLSSQCIQATKIHFSYSNLQPAVFVLQLASHQWYCLTSLKLTSGAVDLAAMQQLQQGALPYLTHLHIEGLAVTNVEALLSSANVCLPRLQSLTLTGFRVNPAIIMAPMYEMHRLYSWKLHGIDFGTDVLPYLYEHQTFKMHDLTITDSHLHAIAALNLFAPSLPHLAVVRLTSCVLNCESIAKLVGSHLPSLGLLDISHSAVDGNAAEMLANGAWPGLKQLCLLGLPFSSEEVQLLIRGRWPNLNSLKLDTKVANVASWKLLHLASDYQSRCDSLVVNADISVCRSPVDPWRKLLKVTFQLAE